MNIPTIYGRHASALGYVDLDLTPDQVEARAEWRRANRAGGAIGAGSAAYFAKRAAALGQQVAVAAKEVA